MCLPSQYSDDVSADLALLHGSQQQYIHAQWAAVLIEWGITKVKTQTIKVHICWTKAHAIMLNTIHGPKMLHATPAVPSEEATRCPYELHAERHVLLLVYERSQASK